MTSLVAETVKRLSTMWETRVRSLGWEDPLEKEMAIHSRTIAWKIPWTEEPGRLQSRGCKESDTTERLHFTKAFIVIFIFIHQVFTEVWKRRSEPDFFLKV